MATICESPTQSPSSEDKWLNYSQVYAKNQFILFDELGLLTNGKKRDGGGSNSGPIYPSKEAAEILYANSVTPAVPIKLISNPCLKGISAHLHPQACQALAQNEIGLGDGKVFEGYASPMGKGNWVYVTPTQETAFKECSITLNKCEKGRVAKKESYDDEGDKLSDDSYGIESTCISICQSPQLQPKKQSSLLQFFSKVPQHEKGSPLKKELQQKTKLILQDRSNSSSRLASIREKRKCTQMHVTPISKPRRKIPRRKMNWSPIKVMTSSSSSSTSSPSGDEKGVIPEPLPSPVMEVTTPLGANSRQTEIEDSPIMITSVLKMIKKSLNRTKLIREKYSKFFNVKEIDDRIPMSVIRSRFHPPSIPTTYYPGTWRQVDGQDELPEDVLVDIFSLEDDDNNDTVIPHQNYISSRDILLSLVPHNENLGFLISFEDDFDDIDMIPCEADDDGFFMEEEDYGFNSDIGFQLNGSFFTLNM